MNIIVIGLGSMGKRRIELIRRMYPEFTIIGTDEREDRREEAEKIFGISCLHSIEECTFADCCAFVCTEPLSHSKYISDCLKRHWHVFTELNLVRDGYEENIALSKKNGRVLFLSSPFLYREENRYIRSSVRSDQFWNYIYHIGQYLPDWHPWENYKDFFVNNQRTNGCREILSIELPWLERSFGKILDAKAVSDKMTGLNIPYHDNFMIQLKHEGGNKGVLVVDIVSPVAVRRFEAYAENSYLAWDGTPESLRVFDSETRRLQSVSLKEQTERKENYSAFIVENMFANEICEFFSCVFSGKSPEYGFEQDKSILEIVDSLGA